MNKIKRKKVAVFVTGGTIVCSFDPTSNRITPSRTGEELLAEMPSLKELCEVELIEYSNMPGPHLTPQIGLKLAREVDRVIESEDFCGAVIVQGTDTLEELAYLFYLISQTKKPIVFTGSMKSNHELYVDAPGNLFGAIRLAASLEASSYGVMVFTNQEILCPHYATKMGSHNIDSFRAIITGSMGIITNERIKFFNKPNNNTRYNIDTLSKNVQLIKAAFGMDEMFLKSCIEAKVDGIVIEGMGAGNLPPNLVMYVEKAIKAKIPVIIVSRCAEGFAVPTYDYAGGGAGLEKIGAVFGEDLSGPKARIKLMVLASMKDDYEYITSHFNDI